MFIFNIGDSSQCARVSSCANANLSVPWKWASHYRSRSLQMQIKVLLVILALLKMYAWIYSKKWICLHWMLHLKRVSLVTKYLWGISILSENHPEIFVFCLRFLGTKCQRMTEKHPPQDRMLEPSIPSCPCCICGNFVKWVLVMDELGIQEDRFILLPTSCLSSCPEIWISSPRIFKPSLPTPSRQWRTVTPHCGSDEKSNELTMEGNDGLYFGFGKWSLDREHYQPNEKSSLKMYIYI